MYCSRNRGGFEMLFSLIAFLLFAENNCWSIRPWLSLLCQFANRTFIAQTHPTEYYLQPPDPAGAPEMVWCFEKAGAVLGNLPHVNLALAVWSSTHWVLDTAWFGIQEDRLEQQRLGVFKLEQIFDASDKTFCKNLTYLQRRNLI